jgi:hypothetical protein
MQLYFLFERGGHKVSLALKFGDGSTAERRYIPWGASKGGLDNEDRIRISYVPHRPSRPPIGYE